MTFFYLPRQDGFNNQMQDVMLLILDGLKLNQDIYVPPLFEGVQWGSNVQTNNVFSHYFKMKKSWQSLRAVPNEITYIYPIVNDVSKAIEHKISKLYNLQKCIVKTMFVPLSDLDFVLKTNGDFWLSYDYVNYSKFGEYSNYENGHGWNVLNPDYKKVLDTLDYTEELSRTADKIILLLDDYASLHIRRGDFKTHRNTDSTFAFSMFDGKTLIDRFGDHSFYQDRAFLIDLIDKKIDENNIFLLSDELSSLKIDIENSTNKRLTCLGDFIDTSRYSIDEIGIIESIIAIHSSTFYGNRYSSFTSSIVNRRHLIQKPSKYF